jgi:hypothetical protein
LFFPDTAYAHLVAVPRGTIFFLFSSFFLLQSVCTILFNKSWTTTTKNTR